MKIRTGIFICLALVLCVMAGAFAESSYQILSDRTGIPTAHVDAWLEIPGAGFTQPVMRHPQEDAYYAKHDAQGRESETGMLYVQAGYNAAGFSDPVTLIYGSSAKTGAPLWTLQEMYSGSFDKLRTILLHLPDGTREYQVFAAVPYSSIHILHYYDFTVERRFNAFFNAVFSTRALGMHLDENNRPVPTDRVLILSTSVRGDKTQRYLVMAKLATP